MKSRLTFLPRLVLLCGLAWGAWCGAPAGAEEPFQLFLDRLRGRGFNDAALMYLEEMKTSSLLAPELKSTLPYEEGRTYLSAAEDEKDGNQKGLFLDKARDKFAEFINANSGHPLIGAASMQQGSVTVERGRMAIDAAGRPSNAAQKDALLKQARDYLGQAHKVFSEAETKFEEKLNQYPKYLDEKNPEEAKLIGERNQTRSDLLQAKLFASTVLYEVAKTYDPKSKDPKEAKAFKDNLQLAADSYEKTYQRFRTLLAGLMARLKQGQCYQEMGDTRRALGLYADIIGQPEELEQLRRQRAAAMYLSMQCWTDEKEKKEELAVQEGEKFLQKTRGIEDKQAEWLTIRYFTALAAKRMADSSKDENAKKSYMGKAREHASLAAKYPGAYQDASRALLRDITGVDTSGAEPTNFVEALERGRASWDEMQIKNNDLKTAATMKKTEEEVATLKTEMEDAKQSALKNFKLALSLRDDQTSVDDVNNIRYYLALMDFLAGKYYDAAVQAEFVATRYPNAAGARPCAKIVLASFLQGYNDKSAQMSPTKDFDMQKMVEMAQYMDKRWPKEPETDEAWYILLSVAVADRNAAQAADYLTHIPEESSKRAEAELKLGQAWWVGYSLASREEGEKRKPQAELDNMVTQAKAMLESGMNRMRSSIEKGTTPVGIDVVLAGLSGAQIYIQSGQPEVAVKLLEDAKIGPLTLVKANDALVQQHEIPTETYKAALRAYVGTQALDKAEAMMGELEKVITAKGSSGQADLTKIYIALGRELEEQVSILRKAGKNDELKKVSNGFELFLKKIGGRDTGNSFGSLNWVSETFYSLGSGYDSNTGSLPPEAEGYYKQSLETDDKMIATALKDKAFAPSPDAVVAVKLRKARCLRRLGKYQEGLAVLTEVLKDKPQLLDAQTESSYLLSDWATKGKKPALYSFAINGTKSTVSKTDKSLVEIWGWGKLSNMLQLNKDYQNIYYEARYNVADCLLQQAQSESGDAKLATLKRAKNTLFLTYKFKPTMGSEIEKENWPEKFDAQVKTIQKLLNEKPLGVKGFDTPAPGTKRTATTTAAGS